MVSKCNVIIVCLMLFGNVFCLASGGYQSLEMAMLNNKFVFEAKIVKLEKKGKQFPSMSITVADVNSLKGKCSGNISQLRFKVQPTCFTDSNGIRGWCILPESGKECSMKEGESWIFFANLMPAGNSKELTIRRAEPVTEKNRVLKLIASVNSVKKPKYISTIDYIAKTKRLWGISEVKINNDNSVTLVDADTGPGRWLVMSLSQKKKSATIKPGESCSLLDGHHATIIYKLEKIDSDGITFLVTNKFDARSFGKGIATQSKTITVLPYKN